MAVADDIDSVKANLPADFSTYGWTEDTIEEKLKAGATIARTTLDFYLAMAAQTSTFVDVQESGSSRQLGQIYRNAKDLVDYWAKVVNLEENPPLEIRAPRARTREINRV